LPTARQHIQIESLRDSIQVKLTPRFTLAFIVYALALLVGVGLLAYQNGRSLLRANTISELEGTALRKEDNLNRWVEVKAADISALASDPVVVTQALAVLMADPNSADFRTPREAFVAILEPRLTPNEYVQVSLINPETGLVVASTMPNEEGKLMANQPFFMNGQSGPYVENPVYSEDLQAFTMIASAPLYSTEGQLVALLAAQLDMESLNLLISRRTNLHETDDAYLVSTSQMFVTRARFIDEPALLAQPIQTEPVKRCVQGESGVMEADDYRNIPSFVAYRWIPDRQMCLVVKIDQAEAYRPIRAFGGTIAVTSAVALLVAAAVAVALARSMTHPILALQRGVARFANGELNVRLNSTSRDELGQLASEFNKMAGVLAEEQTLLRQRAEQFFNVTPDMLCTLDVSGRLLDLNPAWEQTLGYTREELHGKLLTNLIHPDDLAATTVAIQRVIKETTGRFESRCRHKDDSYRWLAWVVVFAPQDQLLYVAARDITERRMDEEKLRQQTEELKRSNQELERFGYVASHDLQEPLRLVSEYVQLLGRRYQGKLDPDADEFISFALDATNRMKSLLADLLTYSKVASREASHGPVLIERTLERVLENLQFIIEDVGAVITYDPLPAVLGDGEQMVQLLQHLIGNALKFRGIEPPRIHIGVRPLARQWLFFIRDNGIGIDATYTEQVFGIFQRLHHQDQYPGTGIGLAIARKIVERHGGRIWVDSEPGKGATFYFTLQPVESWLPEQVPARVVTPRPRDKVTDRAKDLI
jgi:PAS domain S-box-containing protein